MSTIDFEGLSRRLHSQLFRIALLRRVVRILSVFVYLFVFCWLMFVLFGGVLAAYIGSENYGLVTQYIVPVFIGFFVVNFLFSRSLMAFLRQEADAMRNIMTAMFPSVRFSFSGYVDKRTLAESKLFTTSFSDPELAANTYGAIEIPRNGHSLHVADVSISYGLMNKWQHNPILGYLVLIYRFSLKPLFASRVESSSDNFRGMFGWCKFDKNFRGNVIILPDHLEQKIGYLAKNIQGLKKLHGNHLIQLEDPQFENYFSVYTEDEVSARMLLTPAMMRRITELRQSFGHDIMLSFNGDTFCYAASMPSGFLRLRPKALNNEKLLEEIYNEISLSCHVIDELKLE